MGRMRLSYRFGQSCASVPRGCVLASVQETAARSTRAVRDPLMPPICQLAFDDFRSRLAWRAYCLEGPRRADRVNARLQKRQEHGLLVLAALMEHKRLIQPQGVPTGQLGCDGVPRHGAPAPDRCIREPPESLSPPLSCWGRRARAVLALRQLHTQHPPTTQVEPQVATTPTCCTHANQTAMPHCCADLDSTSHAHHGAACLAIRCNSWQYSPPRPCTRLSQCYLRCPTVACACERCAAPAGPLAKVVRMCCAAAAAAAASRRGTSRRCPR